MHGNIIFWKVIVSQIKVFNMQDESVENKGSAQTKCVLVSVVVTCQKMHFLVTWPVLEG